MDFRGLCVRWAYLSDKFFMKNVGRLRTNKKLVNVILLAFQADIMRTNVRNSPTFEDKI